MEPSKKEDDGEATDEEDGPSLEDADKVTMTADIVGVGFKDTDKVTMTTGIVGVGEQSSHVRSSHPKSSTLNCS